MQYQKHPIDRALEALPLILAPSFTLRSSRDSEHDVKKYPLIDYTIVGAQSKEYDPSKNQWRTSYLVVLEMLIEERKPLSWCQYSELSTAHDRHGVCYLMEQMIEKFLVFLVNPSKVSNVTNKSDSIFSDLDFKLVNYIGTQYKFKKGADETTGIYSNFVISCIDQDGAACCLIDYQNIDQLTKLRDLQKVGSNSWRMIDKLINP